MCKLGRIRLPDVLIISVDGLKHNLVCKIQMKNKFVFFQKIPLWFAESTVILTRESHSAYSKVSSPPSFGIIFLNISHTGIEKILEQKNEWRGKMSTFFDVQCDFPLIFSIVEKFDQMLCWNCDETENASRIFSPDNLDPESFVFYIEKR